MIYEITNPNIVRSMFGDWEETMIWSCLQSVMGKIYADDLEHPTAAMAILGDFSFYAGRPSVELVSYKPDWCTQDFIIMTPQNEDWKDTILQFYKDKAKIVSRYAIKKEPDVFDKNTLEKAVSSLQNEYEIRMIDEQLYQMCKAEAWSADLVSNFSTYEDYSKLGLGAVILKDNVIVSGASSYSRYQEGIEIEIDTREDHRQNGLAYVCGAKLILKCLERNLYPSWDAQNKISVALAEKLGYHYSHTYTAVEICGY